MEVYYFLRKVGVNMKILKVESTGFKNCVDNFEISLVPIARKTTEDKEYELEEIAEGLYTFATVGVVGKNASGKTSALELLSIAYEIIGSFRITKKNYDLDGVQLTIFFYNEGFIYRYDVRLEDSLLNESVLFKDQIISKKKYYKSKVNYIFEEEGFEETVTNKELPEDTSKLFFITKGISQRAVFFNSLDMGKGAYSVAFRTHKKFELSTDLMMKIIRVFDENISELEMVDENNYRLVFCGKEEKLSGKELYYRLSSGTTKGMVLYTVVIMSLLTGFDLIIDEIENHFHKTLVENIISLYKDKTINKNNATLIFATHYCEVLDLFSRQDNIYITKSLEKVHIYNMYKNFDIRPELLKSKQFYNDVFKTAVNYEALMDLKRALK